MSQGRAGRAGPLREAKDAMRKRVLAERNAMTPAARAAGSTSIAERLVALPDYAAATTILAVLPFGSEWDARGLVERALRAGKTVALPRVDADARMLVLHAVQHLDRDIAPGFKAIPEPRPATPVIVPEAIDWILVPGVAFDATGGRLGYGGGYYDRLLPLCRADAPRVAGAFALQLVDHVPAAPHDARVHMIVTPEATIQAGAA